MIKYPVGNSNVENKDHLNTYIKKSIFFVCPFVPPNLWNEWTDFDGTFTDRFLD